MKNMRTNPRGTRAASSQRKWWAAPAGFLAAMLAMPATAGIDIPDDPLTTGARVPPNILFVLDDSGSMAFDAMPASSVSSTWTTRTYVHNAVYYNPAKTYLPWVGGNGNLLTGGTSYNAVYGSFNLVGGGTIDLGDPDSCRSYNRNQSPRNTDSGTQVCGGAQTFYVPRNLAGNLSSQSNYYRYQIAEGGTDVVRAEYGAVSGSNQQTVLVEGQSQFTGDLQNNNTVTRSLASVSAEVSLDVLIRNIEDGNQTRNLRYWVNSPSGRTICDGSLSKNQSTTCTVAPTEAGQYTVVLERSNDRSTEYRLSAQRYVSTSCDGGQSGNGWINCTPATTPTGRSVAAEKINFATWFSYHRTRMKAAKAGASAAFNELGSNVRVGFRTIWQQNGTTTSGNWPRQDVPIPVQYNDGLFDDVTVAGVTYDNRSKWYSRLHGSIGQDGTPLHGALYQAGTYYQSSGINSPYGPLTGSDQLACRQNFTIMTTDGYWNNETQNYPSGGRVGNADGTAGPTLTEPTTGASFTYVVEAPYADTHGGTNGTLADVAMRFWKNDLRPDLRNIVPTTTANPAFWQHMVTFGLSIGLSGNTGYGSVSEVPANFASWPNPMPSENASRIDDLLHAAVNSRGTFVAASDPDEFTEGLKSALAAIVERTGSFSNVAANSTAIDSETRVFQANYVSGPWTGELRSQPITLEGGVDEVNCAGTGQPGNGWCASKGIPTVANRNIFTSNGHNNGNPLSPVVTGGITGLAFPSQATADQLASLNRPGPSMHFPVSGAQNAAYIAGERSLELIQGGHLRNRIHLLGDIVGSSPAHVEDTDTIYVGANDGMLHAIDATNGDELFTFIPGIINWAHLGMLSRPDYAHRYFVDGSIVVTTRQQTPDTNILVGALGKGGKGLFALDVTTPGSFGTTDFLWERAETPEGNMGLVQGRPILGKVKDGTALKNAVILGNGMNSASDEAALIVLDLDDGSVIGEISTGAGSAALPNGLSSPTGVFGPDGRTLAYIYAGDMLGNVWKFDLSSTDPASWSVSLLFTATNAGGTAQPISGGVTIATHPTTNKRWVFFGTGRYMTTGDVASTAVQGMYAFTEDADTLSRTDLTQRTVAATGTGPAPHFYPTRAFQSSGALPVGSKGWFIDLPASGERIVQDPQVVSTFLITASMIPSGDACESDGSGFINALNAFTGTSAGGSYFDLDGDGSTTDEYVGDIPVGSVNLGVGMPTLPNLLRGMLVAGGSSGSGLGAPLTLQPRWDRASWREIRGD
ncbi:pilus assembly protein [Luteimonas sp. A534]